MLRCFALLPSLQLPEVSRYESRLGGQAIIMQFNAQQQNVARILRANPDLPGSDDLRRRVRGRRAAHRRLRAEP